MDTPAIRKRLRKPTATTASLSDVAARAGVSTASVSRVLNDSPGVGPVVRERVNRAVAELGYLPNGAARALSSHRSRTIGAIVPTIENHGFAKAIAALQRRLHEADFRLLLASSEYDLDVELREAKLMLAHGADALMLVGGQHHPDLRPLLASRRVPLVETWTMDREHACVGFDNERAARELTDYLVSLGHEDIGLIAGRLRNNDRASARVAGVQAALRRHGLTLGAERLIERPYRILDGGLAMRALLAAGPRKPTAVICGNDQLAFGAMIEARAQGLVIPRDISIAGFNDLDFAAFLNPPLTTVRVPAEEIGRAAGDYLIGQLAGEPVLPVTEVAVSLIVRGSTAPPPGRQTRRPLRERPARANAKTGRRS